MISNYLRSILKEGSEANDYTLAIQNKSASMPFEIGIGDYLYIGQYVPFNNVFVNMKKANTNATKIKVEFWNGSVWVEAVDILDATEGFEKSGVIQWTIKKEAVWAEVEDTEIISGLGLTDFSIYCMFWVRISVDATLSDDCAIDIIRYKFTEESQMSALEPDLSRILAAWDSQKADWLDQILAGSEIVALDLNGKKIINKQAQIFRFY